MSSIWSNFVLIGLLSFFVYLNQICQSKITNNTLNLLYLPYRQLLNQSKKNTSELH